MPTRPAPPTPQFRCQTCYALFSTPFQLEIHIDAYEVRALNQDQTRSRWPWLTPSLCPPLCPIQRLIPLLMERVAKATAHLTPIELVPPDADKFSESVVTSKCPWPSCDSVKPLKDMKFHFTQRMSLLLSKAVLHVRRPVLTGLKPAQMSVASRFAPSVATLLSTSTPFLSMPVFALKTPMK